MSRTYAGYVADITKSFLLMDRVSRIIGRRTHKRIPTIPRFVLLRVNLLLAGLITIDNKSGIREVSCYSG